MARVIAALIRHGDYHQLKDTPSAWQPFPLNEAGRGHARSAAEGIREELLRQDWDLYPVCDSSQLLRAWQTADILCQLLNDNNFAKAIEQKIQLNIESFAALAERSVGSAANLNITQINEIVNDDPRFESLPQDWKSNSHFCLPLQGAESLMDSGKRVAGHLSKVMSELQQSVQIDTVKLFVGHGAAFRHAAHHLGVLEFEQIAKLSMYHGQPVFIERLEDGSWRHVAGHWKVRGVKTSYND